MSSSSVSFDKVREIVQGLAHHFLDVKTLQNVLLSIRDQIDFIDEDLSTIKEDPHHPYSRRVVLNHPNLEVMIARWSSDVPCAPHDHGDSQSAILVLQGCSEHKSYLFENGKLICSATEYKTKGEIITCPPYQIHSMKAHPNLVTLHLYTKSIEDMLVFDLEHKRTFLVNGECGAWVPDTENGFLARMDGYVRRDSIQQEIP